MSFAIAKKLFKKPAGRRLMGCQLKLIKAVKETYLTPDERSGVRYVQFPVSYLHTFRLIKTELSNRQIQSALKEADLGQLLWSEINFVPRYPKGRVDIIIHTTRSHRLENIEYTLRETGPGVERDEFELGTVFRPLGRRI